MRVQATADIQNGSWKCILFNTAQIQIIKTDTYFKGIQAGS